MIIYNPFWESWRFNGKEFKKSFEQGLLGIKISKELSEGKTLEDIIKRNVPMMADEEVCTAAEDIRSGIEEFYAKSESKVTADSVKAQLNKTLADMSNKHRVKYLSGLIVAVTSVNPELALDEEFAQQLEDMAQAVYNSDEDVELLLDTVSENIIQCGTLMSRVSMQGLLDNIDKFDHEAVAEEVEKSEMTVEGFAAAAYIKAQYDPSKSSVKDANTLAFCAAEKFETSKLMAAYSKGKIKLELLSAKVRDFFSLITVKLAEFVKKTPYYALGGFVSVKILAKPIYKFMLKALRNVALGPYAILALHAASYILGYAAFTQMVTFDDLRDGFNLLKGKISDVWDAIVSHFKDKLGATDTEEAEFEAESAEEAELETEDDTEAEYIPEREEESDFEVSADPVLA